MPPTFNYLTNSQAAGESTTLSSATITPQNTGDWLLVASSYPYATPTNAWQNMTWLCGWCSAADRPEHVAHQLHISAHSAARAARQRSSLTS